MKKILIVMFAVVLCVLTAGCDNRPNNDTLMTESETPFSEETLENGQAESTETPVPTLSPATTLQPAPTPSPAVSSDAERKARLLSYEPVHNYHDLGKIEVNTDGWDGWGYKIIEAFVEKDTETLEKLMDLPKGTYDNYKTIELSGYLIKWIDSNNHDYPYIQFSFNIKRSENEVLTPGEHAYIIDPEYPSMFKAGDSYVYDEYTSACRALDTFFSCGGYRYVLSIPDFESYYKENKEELCRNLTHAILSLNGYDNGLTEKEIIEKAKKYFNISDFEPDVTWIEKHEDGKYYHPGHGGTSFSLDIISEEIIDGVTVITIQYYADWSKTVYSHLIEYRLIELDDGYAFLPSKTIMESLLTPIAKSF